MNRRQVLYAIGLAGLASLPGCTTSTVNGVTTVTVNTADAVSYLSGLAALGTSLLSFPGFSTALGGNLSVFTTVIADVDAAGAAVVSASGGSAGFSFDTTSVPAFITSMEANVNQLLALASAAVSAVGAALPTKVAAYWAGAQVVAAAIIALFSIPTAAVPAAAKLAAPTMTVAQALALVGITAPAAK
jgi:hypothetical protein